MKTKENNTEQVNEFYQNNYDSYMIECIDDLIKHKTNDIEMVTDTIASDKLREFENMGILDELEESLWEVNYDVRGQLVKLYNIWHKLIEKEIKEYLAKP